jgi:type II secretory pathway pseudopilin PulG
MSRRLDSRGAVLLEVIIGLAVLGTVGGAAAWLASESIRAVTHAHAEEQRVRTAARLLTAASLWPREDLDRHLGTRAQGPWRMHVNRIMPTLYEVSLADSATGRLLLRTAVFRPDVEP